MGTLVAILFGLAILGTLIANVLALRSRMSRYSAQEREADPELTRTMAIRWLLLGVLVIGGLVAVYALTR